MSPICKDLFRPGDVTNQTRPELFWIQLYNVRTMYMPCGLEFTLTQLYTNPNLWTKVEPEPKINNLGSATLRSVLIIYFFENQQNILIILVHHVFLCVTVQDSILYSVYSEMFK